MSFVYPAGSFSQMRVYLIKKYAFSQVNPDVSPATRYIIKVKIVQTRPLNGTQYPAYFVPVRVSDNPQSIDTIGIQIIHLVILYNRILKNIPRGHYLFIDFL